MPLGHLLWLMPTYPNMSVMAISVSPWLYFSVWVYVCKCCGDQKKNLMHCAQALATFYFFYFYFLWDRASHDLKLCHEELASELYYAHRIGSPKSMPPHGLFMWNVKSGHRPSYLCWSTSATGYLTISKINVLKKHRAQQNKPKSLVLIYFCCLLMLNTYFLKGMQK